MKTVETFGGGGGWLIKRPFEVILAAGLFVSERRQRKRWMIVIDFLNAIYSQVRVELL